MVERMGERKRERRKESPSREIKKYEKKIEITKLFCGINFRKYLERIQKKPIEKVRECMIEEEEKKIREE